MSDDQEKQTGRWRIASIEGEEVLAFGTYAEVLREWHALELDPADWCLSVELRQSLGKGKVRVWWQDTALIPPPPSVVP
jgi:hypothetical protein